jgi:hypothetical protein
MTTDEIKNQLVKIITEQARDHKADLLSGVPFLARGIAGRVYEKGIGIIPTVVEKLLIQISESFLSMTGADLLRLLTEIKMKAEYNR